MISLRILLVLSVVFNGTLAGLSLDTALVKLPARKRIGAVAYAIFARGNDLGNGRVIYPAWAIISALLAFAAAILALVNQASKAVLLDLAIASALTIAHFLATGKAAPVMLSIKDAPDDERSLSAKLDVFARWHAVRATLQLLAFLALIGSLLMGR